jgi:hypothetical protein
LVDLVVWGAVVGFANTKLLSRILGGLSRDLPPPAFPVTLLDDF